MLVSSLQTGKDWQTPQSGRGRYVAFRFFHFQIRFAFMNTKYFHFRVLMVIYIFGFAFIFAHFSYEVHVLTRNLENGKNGVLLYPAISICVTSHKSHFVNHFPYILWMNHFRLPQFLVKLSPSFWKDLSELKIWNHHSLKAKKIRSIIACVHCIQS